MLAVGDQFKDPYNTYGEVLTLEIVEIDQNPRLPGMSDVLATREVDAPTYIPGSYYCKMRWCFSSSVLLREKTKWIRRKHYGNEERG